MIVELKESELRMVGLAPVQFRALPINERRWIASSILRARPASDRQSQFSASMMERANPNFNQFTILSGV